MSEYVYAGLTSQTIDLFIRDSASTTGQGLTGLAYNSGSLVASYRKGATGSRTAITLATQTVGGAFSSGGFVEIDATNMPGVYRLDLPNAAVDAAGFVTVFLKGAANMVPVALRIDCRPVPADLKQIGADAQSATDLKDFVDSGYDPSTNKLTGAVELDPTSVNAVADQVWDEAYADHNTAGSFGKLLNTIRKANLAIDGTVSVAITPTTLTFSSNVAATTSAYAHAVLLFTTGALAGENSPIISYTNTNGVFLLEEPLTSAPSNGDEFVVIAGSHVHSVADIQSGLSTLTAPQVNSEVLDVLSVDTFVELTSPPAATSSLKDKLTWLFMWVRNKGTATATQRKLYADDGTTLISTEAITDDGTTFTKGEAS